LKDVNIDEDNVNLNLKINLITPANIDLWISGQLFFSCEEKLKTASKKEIQIFFSKLG
jgi:hypothetical protein